MLTTNCLILCSGTLSCNEYCYLFTGVTPTTEQCNIPQSAVDKERQLQAEQATTDVARPFLHALAESRVQDPTVKVRLESCEHRPGSLLCVQSSKRLQVCQAKEIYDNKYQPVNLIWQSK